ncbi:Scr1 family TA system antitoxin-like transcriptional regulator [Kozakia baliensis]|uniref:Scr1 family TA system antitoxin-like transcriptional regulator n=1 Tax=Kozakia baliensis TaxID=153496 RepID=UPI00087D9F98|nr:Scr1 family TA system antitoxin-like transcriptional regulator [Kozakia baliensis]AOX19086.1 transcriptional regulator [Kozakia baliensis]
MDKRLLAQRFRDRLTRLMLREGCHRAAFADRLGLDRSALSLLLATDSARLPRADTLLQIASRMGVTTDWLLGAGEEDQIAPPSDAQIAMEENATYHNIPLLMRWHAEAAGTKIRYVPHRLPDLLRTPSIVAYEARQPEGADQREYEYIARHLDFKREPGTDMEVCMSVQSLENLAAGDFPWDGLAHDVRKAQLQHIIRVADELYPSFRVFLFDERHVHTVPYTIFGTHRAAIYAGDIFLVLNQKEAVSRMQKHFETLIRHAVVQPHDFVRYVQSLEKTMTETPARQAVLS